jgi:hypothetical protein
MVKDPDGVETEIVRLLRDGERALPRLRGITACVLTGPTLWNDHAKFHEGILDANGRSVRNSDQIESVGWLAVLVVTGVGAGRDASGSSVIVSAGVARGIVSV